MANTSKQKNSKKLSAETKKFFKDLLGSNATKEVLSKPLELTNLDCSYIKYDNLDFLENFPNLISINLRNSHFKNVDGLKFCPKLEFISLYSASVEEIISLDFLENLQVVDLQFSNFKDLTILKGCKSIKTLSCINCKITDYSLLETFENLERFSMSNNFNPNFDLHEPHNPIPFFDKIPKMPKSLIALDISNCGFLNLNGLEHLESLEHLTCDSYNDTLLSDVSAIENLEKLQGVSLRCAGIQKFKSISNIQHLNLDNCANLEDIEIPNVKYLNFLNIDNTNIENFDFLKNVQGCKYLSAYNSKIDYNIFQEFRKSFSQLYITKFKN